VILIDKIEKKLFGIMINK